MHLPYIFTIPKGQRRLTSRHGNAYDVGRLIKSIISQSVRNATIIEFVQRHPMNEKQIFDYVYSKASFKPDVRNVQVVKTPLATIRTKRANCVNYSTLLGTLLRLNNIPGKLRLVTFKGDKFPKHIFVVTDTGKVLDCVIGQGHKEVSIADRENKTGKYNQEVKYFVKFDIPY